MRISDWSSDVCSSDLLDRVGRDRRERLLDIPGAAGLGITEPAHHREEAVDRRCFRDWGHPLRLLSLSVIIYLMGNHGSTDGAHGRYPISRTMPSYPGSAPSGRRSITVRSSLR